MAETFNPQKQLEKHGWKQGSGLGKAEHGIKEAIKVKIKQDKTGVGHDPGEEFSYHWWDHVFNKAANNIQVEQDEDSVKVKKTGDCHISKKKARVQKLEEKPRLYGMFVKSATLTSEGHEIKETKDSDSDSSDSDEGDVRTASKCTDEELFKLCGGLTAHKAARHGHGLGGKLQRIADQEAAQALQQQQQQQYQVNGHSAAEKSPSAAEVPGTEVPRKKRNKKDKSRKKEKSKTFESGTKNSLNSEDCDTVELECVTKKKKRKHKSHDVECVASVGEMSPEDGVLGNNGIESEPKIKKPKKKKEKHLKNDKNASDCEMHSENEVTVKSKKPKKKKKKRKQSEER